MRVLVLLAGAVAATVTALALWSTTQLGYPRLVYYQRALVTTTGPAALPPDVEELWSDPVAEVFRYQSQSGGIRSGFVIRDGLSYPLTGHGTPVGWPLPPGEARTLLGTSRALAGGGYPNLGRWLLDHALSPAVVVRVDGRPALRFDTGEHAEGLRREVVWLAPITLEPLRLDYVFAGGVVKTERFQGTARLASHTLPLGFFDPMAGQGTFWEWAHDWLRAHLTWRPAPGVVSAGS